MSSNLTIFSDGGARGNPGPAAIGVYITDEQGSLVAEHGEAIGEATNNIAEYMAVIVGLEFAKKLGAQKVDYFVDSQLVANQINGLYKIKTPHIRTLYQKVKESLQGFKEVKFTHVPRTHEGMREADRLVNEALDEAGH